MIPGRRFQWAVDEPISSVPMLRYSLSPSLQLLSFFTFSFFLVLLRSPLFSLYYLSVSLSSCVSLICFLSLSLRWLKSFIPYLSLFLSVSAAKPNSRSICDLEGFRTEAGYYRPLFRPGHENTENRDPILSAKKFIARSTLIGREIIGHSFSPSARSKRLSLIHDFSRIIAGPCHRFPLPLSSFRRSVKHLLFLSSGFLATSRHHSDRIQQSR